MRWLFQVTVAGESMWPVLVPGKTYWASSLVPLAVGKIVVAQNPVNSKTYLIKKIHSLSGSQLKLAGTVSWSSSPTVDRQNVLGVLIN